MGARRRSPPRAVCSFFLIGAPPPFLVVARRLCLFWVGRTLAIAPSPGCCAVKSGCLAGLFGVVHQAVVVHPPFPRAVPVGVTWARVGATHGRVVYWPSAAGQYGEREGTWLTRRALSARRDGGFPLISAGRCPPGTTAVPRGSSGHVSGGRGGWRRPCQVVAAPTVVVRGQAVRAGGAWRPRPLATVARNWSRSLRHPDSARIVGNPTWCRRRRRQGHGPPSRRCVARARVCYGPSAPSRSRVVVRVLLPRPPPPPP